MIAIATITRYPAWYPGDLRSLDDTDKIRGDLALTFVNKATNLGYRIVVADSKSSKEFQQEIQSHQVTYISRVEDDRGPALRHIVTFISTLPKISVIAVSEPEKVDLIRSIQVLSHPITDGTADIVIPKRELSLFQSSYPDFQFESETLGNSQYNSLLRSHKLLLDTQEDVDIFFGPILFRNSNDTTSLFSGHWTNIGCGPVAAALKEKKRVRSITVPFAYPASQKINETGKQYQDFKQKRIYQRTVILQQLTEFLLNYTTYTNR